MVAKAVRKPNLSGSWALLGRSWWLLGRSEDLLGRSVGIRGRSWSAFWLPGEVFLERVGFFVGTPCEITKTCKFTDSTALFAVFHGPEGSKSCPKLFENQSFSQEVDLDGQEVALDG